MLNNKQIHVVKRRLTQIIFQPKCLLNFIQQRFCYLIIMLLPHIRFYEFSLILFQFRTKTAKKNISFSPYFCTIESYPGGGLYMKRDWRCSLLHLGVKLKDPGTKYHCFKLSKYLLEGTLKEITITNML